jgi:hypothetical protein
MSSSTRWVKRPEGSTWGDFGPDDQRGRINLLTPEKIKQGVGKSCLLLRFSDDSFTSSFITTIG